MCLSLICGVQYYQFKVSNVFPFMEGEVFISVIWDKNVDHYPVLDLVNAINYVNVRCLIPLGVLSSSDNSVLYVWWLVVHWS